MRLFALLIFVLTLSACASAPQQHAQQDMDSEVIQAHQQSLLAINAWEFQSRMAFIDHQENSRQSASLRWQNSPQQRALRISHPLRGTLASIEETDLHATLTDRQGHQFTAPDIESLLLSHLNVFLPIDLIHDALLGRLPQTQIINPEYYAEGTLAAYEVDIEDQRWLPGQQARTTTWQVNLGRYQPAANQAVSLPHQLELNSTDYQIRLSISRWTILATDENNSHAD